MRKGDRRKGLRCLHPDARAAVSERQLTEAFQILDALPIREIET